MNNDEQGATPSEAGAVTSEEAGHTREASLIVRVLVCIVVLAVGVMSMALMVYLKEEPAEAVQVERALPVETLQVAPEIVPVVVTGLGEVRALNVVPLSAEVPGLVAEVHPNLEVGEKIPAGALLFRLDASDYIAARDRAAAQVRQFEKTVERLTRQMEIDTERLSTIERNEALMKAEHERVKALYEQDDVGTRSAVDQSEMAFNQAADARDQLGQAVSLYPVQIEEAQSGLQAARAQLALADANLSRTEVRAEFDARVKSVNLELGQYVNPGMTVVTLADDRVLEISVSLDSRDARSWLQFEGDAPGAEQSWFGAIKPVTCSIYWTEAPDARRWEGTADRIENFDPQTRTVTVAVRISPEGADVGGDGLPLVEGMFCQVEIPGKSMEQVFRLPRWAVTYEGNVYLARDNRLMIHPVEVVRNHGEETFVKGLAAGDEVITTRLVNPLPNTLLAPEAQEAAPS
ncbi:MAG: HlyD family efflux transporter periplasmic adaptor subunit [Candidatus Hydrogenedentes bacterium]|nr:HlyD family efflux transporter periplasmic adaptor subunit [Candidatus Hydrogenedentota bacterium]